LLILTSFGLLQTFTSTVFCVDYMQGLLLLLLLAVRRTKWQQERWGLAWTSR